MNFPDLLHMPLGPELPSRVVEGILNMSKYNRKESTDNFLVVKRYMQENDKNIPCQNLVVIQDYFDHCIRMIYCGDVCLKMKVY